ncbi:MAG: histidine phosphatase family protein, partial [Pseudomonadota bacterium]
MTTFWWVRHGPTHEKAFTGWRDVPADLSDTAALQRLSAFLPSDAPI